MQHFHTHRVTPEIMAQQKLGVFRSAQQDLISQPITQKSVTDRLPNEILAMILARLPKSSMKTVRLTCKLYAVLAVPSLFDLAVISPSAENLDVFNALARSPLSKYVKQIDFDTTMFRKECDLDTYRIGVKYQQQVSHSEESITEADITNGFEAYRAHAEEQQRLLESGEFLASFCLGLSEFKQLRSITLNGSWTRDRQAIEMNRRGALRRNWNPRYLRACPCAGQEHDTSSRLNARAFTDILRGLSMFGVKLESFCGKTAILVPAYHFGSMSALALSHGIGAFCHLRTLSFAFTHNTTTAASTALFGMIRSAHHLRDLVLLFYPAMTICIDDLIKSHTWPHLETLRLHGVQVNQDELLAMVDRHAGSLRRLSINTSRLVCGTWLHVAKVVIRLHFAENCSFINVCDDTGDFLRSWTSSLSPPKIIPRDLSQF
ncbi:MAG: hypothetical protein Q9187_005756 [Circinaria calcarea]